MHRFILEAREIGRYAAPNEMASAYREHRIDRLISCSGSGLGGFWQFVWFCFVYYLVLTGGKLGAYNDDGLLVLAQPLLNKDGGTEV